MDEDKNSTGLIVIQSKKIDDRLVQTVDARELHEFLEVGRDFTTWIKDRIHELEFVEDQDFVSFPQNGGIIGRGRPSIEYYISLDMAKELSMVEHNDKGQAARRTD